MLYPLVRTSSVFPSGLTMVVTACPARYCGLSARPGFTGTNEAPVGATGVICWPLLGMVCCAHTGGMREHAKNVAAAIFRIVLLKYMPDLEWGNENEEESVLVQAICGSELPMKMLAP